jgi:uncharacterized integral membrane protein (TIGR00698 family)
MVKRLPSWTFLVALVLMPLLIAVGNPAIALLAGAALVLTTDALPCPSAQAWGRYALQAAIVLLGFQLNLGQLLTISADYSAIVSGYVLFTLLLGLVLGKLLRSERQSSQLLASGTAICGGTTIASLSPVIKARPDQTAVALSLVFLLNAVALFTFPLVGDYLEMSQRQFGTWAALAIHDTSSVIATGSIYGEEAARVATTVKLGRTLWLIPLMLLFSIVEGAEKAKLRVPGFILLFMVAAAISPWLQETPLLYWAPQVSKALLCIALFCIGMEINRATLRQLRGSALVQGVLLWLLVAPLSLLLILYLG